MSASIFSEFANEFLKLSGVLGSDKSFVKGLTPKQVHILMEVGQNTFRHGDLASNLGVDPSTLTRTLDPLDKAGYIDRQMNPENRREVLIRLSEHGLSVLQEVNQKMNELYTLILAQVPDGKVEQVESSISILLNIIKQMDFKH
ncbi:MarR family winged helix-turn-helix transcriptional regulator [Bacillus sp. CGMCC 1.16607]|uniref:MarR family winged helix-turn-helix transcriptional regulator n=1 Tax=Bacillus sp. CGMCC 1.16607 TaxID=3351842 RepID=UPI00362DB259